MTRTFKSDVVLPTQAAAETEVKTIERAASEDKMAEQTTCSMEAAALAEVLSFNVCVVKLEHSHSYSSATARSQLGHS